MLSSGTRLGRYEIVAPIGAGGMGEVYRARDTRLDRSVAVKILPAELAQNAQFRVRFEREAKTISQLSHPNICTLFDVGENFLVMELLEGETLADRVSRGPLPLPEVLKVGTQIAEALGRAHRAGIIHRDLKPGNIMLTKSGAKLLDFGLAKSSAPALVPDGATVQKPLTQEGTILGTFQYMAPEQLAGEEPDARTDIFALGAVLYEMATGKRAFEGKTKTSLIGAIVSGEPKPMHELQPLTPPALEHAVKKCLSKDPDDRWQSASDVAEELRWVSEAGSQAGAAISVRVSRARREMLAWVLAAMAIAVAGVMAWRANSRLASVPQLRVAIPLPPGTGADSVTISPDGKEIIFGAGLPLRKSNFTLPTLFLHRLDRFESVPLTGVEGLDPFFSQDGQWIAFESDGKLMKISPAGGAPLEICAGINNGRGGSWGPNGTIYFAPTAGSGIWKVSNGGGQPAPLTRLNGDEVSHRWPQLLPDGKHLLVTVKTASQVSIDNGRIAVVSLPDGGMRTVLDGGWLGKYVDGSLLFLRGGTLYAVPFDLQTLRVTGAPKPIIGGISGGDYGGAQQFDSSADGTIVSIPAALDPATDLVLVDPKENASAASGVGTQTLTAVRLSPDGRMIAMEKDAANNYIALFDRGRGTTIRLSFDPGNCNDPVWTADGSRVIYRADLAGSKGSRILWKKSDGSGPSEELIRSTHSGLMPSSVSPDGNLLAYVEAGSIWFLSLTDHKQVPVVQTPFHEDSPEFSPDGKWLAYTSDESGRSEVYLLSLSATAARRQISTDGGESPRWSHDGSEIFYWKAGSLYAAKIASAAAGKPELILKETNTVDYDIAPDGQVLLLRTTAPPAAPTLNLVTNGLGKLR